MGQSSELEVGMSGQRAVCCDRGAWKRYHHGDYAAACQLVLAKRVKVRAVFVKSSVVVPSSGRKLCCCLSLLGGVGVGDDGCDRSPDRRHVTDRG